MTFVDFFSPFQWQVLLVAAQIARDLGGHLYAVGGVVRDYLLHYPTIPIDIDLVIEGSGIDVATSLHKFYPDARLQTHPKFLTAEIFFPGFTIDIATARQEHYAYPGANPHVMPCSLSKDLERRDFTINALALAISPINLSIDVTSIIDRFGGITDLQQQLIRPIRSESFLEDPRRIFRAVRFAVKLGFRLATETVQEIRTTIASGVHTGLGGSRLRAELLYILHPTFLPNQSTIMLSQLHRLQAWQCLHADLHICSAIGTQLHRLNRWQRYFLGDTSLTTLALELILKDIPVQDLIAKELILTGESNRRLQQLPNLINVMQKLLTNGNSTSTIVFQLQSFDVGTMVILGSCSDMPTRRLLWQYLTQWRNLAPLLTGSDLKHLGCTEGKQIGIWLKQIRILQLDGKISTTTQAKERVKQWLLESSP